jgi:hypothetical protein
LLLALFAFSCSSCWSRGAKKSGFSRRCQHVYFCTSKASKPSTWNLLHLFSYIGRHRFGEVFSGQRVHEEADYVLELLLVRRLEGASDLDHKALGLEEEGEVRVAEVLHYVLRVLPNNHHLLRLRIGRRRSRRCCCCCRRRRRRRRRRRCRIRRRARRLPRHSSSSGSRCSRNLSWRSRHVRAERRRAWGPRCCCCRRWPYRCH